jgi:hypothetical protein
MAETFSLELSFGPHQVGVGTESTTLKQRRLIQIGAAQTAMPALGSRVLDFYAEAITPQTDNTALPSWTDSVAALTITQGTGANQPRYRTSRLNSKPAVQFQGNQWLPVGAPAVLVNALNHYNDATGVTMFWIVANVGAVDNTSDTLWGPTSFDGEASIVLNQVRSGPFNHNRTVAIGSGLQVLVARSNSFGSHFFHNFNASGAADIAAFTRNFSLGGTADGTTFTFKGDIMQWGVYGRSLSNAEIAQLVKYACDKYGAAYPWAGRSRFVMFDGDSITYGTGASGTTGRSQVNNCWPILLAEAKSIPWGGHSNMAVAGLAATTMASAASQNYAGLAAQLGMPIALMAMEYYNQPDTNAASFKSFLDAVKAADSSIKICALTSTDNGAVAGNAVHDNRAAFNAALVGYANLNVLAPLHTDATVGVEGACPNDPGPYGPNFADDRHPANPGYAAMATFLSSYYDTVIAL